MKRKSPFLEILVRRFLKPPRIARSSGLRNRGLGFGLRSSPASIFRVPRSILVRSVLVLALLTFVLPAYRVFAAVREVGPIGLTVGDLKAELAFYTNTLPFELISISDESGPDQDALFGLKDTRLRVAILKLGDESITLTEHVDNPGNPVPPDSRSFDHWFQHIAIVVSDMDKAYDRLRQHNVKHVSTTPQTLPDWNKNAGGIKAFYFRDPEDHVLEIIWFPLGKGDPKWQSSRRRKEADTTAPTESASSRRRLQELFVGIDHTAIVVSDTERSLGFYRDLLGLRVAGESENYGVEQEHLNQVFGARLRITALRAAHGPGIEFLEYITPPGGRPLPDDANASDRVFWLTHLTVDDLAELPAALNGSGARAISRSGVGNALIFRDPDGHALELDGLRTTAAASGAR